MVWTYEDPTEGHEQGSGSPAGPTLVVAHGRRTPRTGRVGLRGSSVTGQGKEVEAAVAESPPAGPDSRRATGVARLNRGRTVYDAKKGATVENGRKEGSETPTLIAT